MNVLQVIETGGPGGAETIVANLCSELVARGHRVHAVIGDGSWLPAELTRRAISHELIRTHGSGDTGLLKQMRLAIRNHNATIVHGHLFEGSVYASIAARAERVPFIATLHGQVDVSRLGLRSRVKRAIFLWLTARVVTVSAALQADLMKRFHAPCDRFMVIPNGVVCQAIPNHLRGARTRRQLVAVGNIRVPKDYPNLLSALRIVCDALPDVQLAIVGEPDQDGLYEQLGRQVHQLGLTGNVVFHGFLPDPTVVLRDADCFVLASTHEGFSLATIEAMVAGIPVVATRSGGPEEILRDNETGILVPPSNAHALAAGILRVLQDPPLAASLSHTARGEASERFSVHKMTETYLQAYHDVVASA